MTCWTAEAVEAAMQRAALALRQSKAAGRGPRGMVGGGWDIVRTREEAYGYTAETGARLQADAADLALLDRVLGWIASYLSRDACRRAQLVEDAGKIAWMRASGRPFPAIADERAKTWGGKPPGGNSRETLRAIVRAVHAHLARRLNDAGVPVAGADHTEEGEMTRRHEPGRRVTMSAAAYAPLWVRGNRPCGDCMHFQPADAEGGMSRCRRFNTAVTRTMRAQYRAGEPCFEGRTGDD